MKSKFNGGLLGYIGIGLLMFVIIVFSLGLATPWAICIGARWYAKHTTIDGRQVVFDGTGWQLFGNFVKWFFLSIITLFIFSLWIPIKMAKWAVKHIHLESAEEPVVTTAPAQSQNATFMSCPDCGHRLSSRAQMCVHCGAPITVTPATPTLPAIPEEPIASVTPADSYLKIKLGASASNREFKKAKMVYVFTDDATGETLATAAYNQTVTLNLTEPTTIRCHLKKGWKDAILNYAPGENTNYRVVSVEKLFGAPHLEFRAVDKID